MRQRPPHHSSSIARFIQLIVIANLVNVGFCKHNWLPLRVWPRGEAAVCKTVHVGSNPAIRSTLRDCGSAFVGLTPVF